MAPVNNNNSNAQQQPQQPQPRRVRLRRLLLRLIFAMALPVFLLFLLLFGFPGSAAATAGSAFVSVCGPVRRGVARLYTDIENFPLRTPDLAVDAVVLREVPNSSVGRPREAAGGSGVEVLLCNRSRPPRSQLALPGGYVEVGEAVESALLRELFEETALDLAAWLADAEVPAAAAKGGTRRVSFPEISLAAGNITGVRRPQAGNSSNQPTAAVRAALFGIFSNPTRDRRRHTASAVFTIFLPLGSAAAHAVPRARDDVRFCRYWGVPRVLDADNAARAAAAGGRGIIAFDHAKILAAVFASVGPELNG